MKYRAKKSIHGWFKIVFIFSVFALFISPSVAVAKVAGTVALAFYVLMFAMRYFMKLPYVKARQKLIETAYEPEFIFEWFTISWVVTVLGLAIPSFLYSQDFISLISLKRILTGGLVFLVIYAVSVLSRYLLHRKNMKALEEKSPEDYFKT